jgi:hypothetical protein
MPSGGRLITVSTVVVKAPRHSGSEGDDAQMLPLKKGAARAATGTPSKAAAAKIDMFSLLNLVFMLCTSMGFSSS